MRHGRSSSPWRDSDGTRATEVFLFAPRDVQWRREERDCPNRCSGFPGYGAEGESGGPSDRPSHDHEHWRATAWAGLVPPGAAMTSPNAWLSKIQARCLPIHQPWTMGYPQASKMHVSHTLWKGVNGSRTRARRRETPSGMKDFPATRERSPNVHVSRRVPPDRVFVHFSLNDSRQRDAFGAVLRRRLPRNVSPAIGLRPIGRPSDGASRWPTSSRRHRHSNTDRRYPRRARRSG